MRGRGGVGELVRPNLVNSFAPEAVATHGGTLAPVARHRWNDTSWDFWRRRSPMELALGLFLSALGALLFVVQAIVVVMAARLGDWANAAELVVGALFAAAT